MRTFAKLLLALLVLLHIPISAIDFVAIQAINPSIVIDIRYATENNFTGKVIYPRVGCYLRKAAAAALDKVQKALTPLGLGLKVFDGYRPRQYQEILWAAMPVEGYVANPRKGSKHTRGAAVDLTLIRLSDGKELEMPSDYDDLSEKAHRNYSAMNGAAAKNCHILEDAMIKQGFIPLPSEWWHFDYQGWEQYALENISFDEIDAANKAEEHGI